MSRTAAKINQADIARALRAVRQVAGSAQVVFDPDGRVRVTPLVDSEQPKAVDPDEEIDL